jgi:prepilin-type N-terminal cleavage/methylation domain-containing protein
VDKLLSNKGEPMRNRGFSLIELLTILTISAILVAAAVPSFQWFIARNRVADASNLLQTTLQYARLEATRRGQTVVVCRAQDASVAVPVCSSVAVGDFDGNDWANGWVMFSKTDPNANAAAFEVGDIVLKRHTTGAVGGEVRLNLHSNLGGAERIAFPPHATAGTAGAGTFAVDYRQPDLPATNSRAFGAFTVTAAGRCLVVAPLIGTMRVAAPVAGSC